MSKEELFQQLLDVEMIIRDARKESEELRERLGFGKKDAPQASLGPALVEPAPSRSNSKLWTKARREAQGARMKKFWAKRRRSAA